MAIEISQMHGGNRLLSQILIVGTVAIFAMNATRIWSQKPTESAQIVGSSMEPTLAGLRVYFECGNCELSSFFAGRATGACPRCNSASCRLLKTQLSPSYRFEPLRFSSESAAKANLQRGDIVVFEPDKEQSKGKSLSQVTKRLIGFPSESINFERGSILINGRLWKRREIYFESATVLGRWRVSKASDRGLEITAIDVPTAGCILPRENGLGWQILDYQHRTFWPLEKSQQSPPVDHQITLDSWFNPTERIEPAIAHHFGVNIRELTSSVGALRIEFAFSDAELVVDCTFNSKENMLIAAAARKNLDSRQADKAAQSSRTRRKTDSTAKDDSPTIIQFELPANGALGIARKNSVPIPLELAICDRELLVRVNDKLQCVPIEFLSHSWQPDSIPIRIAWPTSGDQQHIEVAITRGVEYRNHARQSPSFNARDTQLVDRYFVIGDNTSMSSDSRQDPDLLTSATQIRGKLAASEKRKLGVAKP